MSVVLNFLNEERFLEEAVHSVCNQTLQDWELILVDDGSTDQSTKIARELATRDARIRCIDHPGHENKGGSASRNLGVANTTAPYIAFIDGDDVWVPTKLAEQVELLERMPGVAMVNGALRYWYGWDPAATEEDETVLTGGVADRRIDPPEAALTIYPLVLVDGAGVDLLVRRSVFDAVGGFEERFRGMYDEQSLLVKVFLRYPIYISSRAWLLYRQHDDSCCARISQSAYFRVRGAFLDWLKDDVERLGDPRVSAALRRARRRNRLEQLHVPTPDMAYRLRSRIPAKYKDPVKRCVRLARSYRARSR
ncbi:MAG: glycosyltransferase family 2 protein [Actinomycetia bacterium]|nr:glycosyltransferase family 2 protein [Actinomycetes bacterium]